ncbi:acylneuraminate cytidylyltransferase [bacterium]|nr:MAG: acylneuraminate cytidylyltransferase [bacterium]
MYFPRGINKKVGIIVQARMGSTRLPGKVLMKLVDSESILGYLLKRLSGCSFVDKIIVATTTNPKDDILERWLKKRKQDFYRGSEDDCIKRYYKAADKFGLDIVIRITSDCPFILPDIVDEMVKYYLFNMKDIDYLSNRQATNFPEGTDVEIFTSKMLQEAQQEAKLKEEREHVNNFFLNRPTRYRIRYYNHNLRRDYSRFKLSIDTAEDLKKAKSFLKENNLPLNFAFKDLAKALSNII